MVYDDGRSDWSLPHYQILSTDRAKPQEQEVEPPRNDADRALIAEVIERFPAWSAERIHERIRRHGGHSSLGAINYVLAERHAQNEPGRKAARTAAIRTRAER